MSLPVKNIPESLCIIRLSAIGDVSHMIPVIHTLQTAWPNCKITWIIGKIEAGLVNDLPGVEFIIFDKTKGFAEYLQLRKKIRGRHFDLLLHMQVALRASLISLLIDAPVKLGFDKQRAHDYQWLFTNHRISGESHQHVLDGFFGFLQALGIHEKRLEWDIPIPPEATAFAEQHLSKTQPILVINPCSSARLRNWRNWAPEKYAKIADYAASQHHMQLIITGGPATAEQAFAEHICSLTQAPVTNLTGKTSLKEMLAILKQATAVIAPDTGPTHIATAAGTPVIGLYAGSNPERTGPYLNRQYMINKYPEALQRYANKTIEQARWGERVRNPEVMDLIAVKDVADMLDTLLTQERLSNKNSKTEA